MMHPLEDRVVIELAEEEERTAGGLFIPDVGKEKPAHGTIVSVGPGKWNVQHWKHDPMFVSVGMSVTFGKYSGTEIGGYLVIRAGDILTVNTPDEPRAE